MAVKSEGPNQSVGGEDGDEVSEVIWAVKKGMMGYVMVWMCDSDCGGTRWARQLSGETVKIKLSFLDCLRQLQSVSPPGGGAEGNKSNWLSVFGSDISKRLETRERRQLWDVEKMTPCLVRADFLLLNDSIWLHKDDADVREWTTHQLAVGFLAPAAAVSDWFPCDYGIKWRNSGLISERKAGLRLEKVAKLTLRWDICWFPSLTQCFTTFLGRDITNFWEKLISKISFYLYFLFTEKPGLVHIVIILFSLIRISTLLKLIFKLSNVIYPQGTIKGT